MANARISRKSLKEPDEFISFSSKLLQQAVEHKTKMVWGMGVLFGVVMLVSGILYFSEKNENKGSLILARMIDRYTDSMKMNGPAKAYEIVASDFQKIIDDYSRQDCGKFARLIFANICYRSGNFDKAIALYMQAMDDFKNLRLLRNIAASSLGYVYEEKKEYSKAAGIFESLSTDRDVIMADETLFTLGRLYGLLEKNDMQAKVMSQLADKHSDSIYKELVQ